MDFVRRLYDTTFDNKIIPQEEIFIFHNINVEKINIYINQKNPDGSDYLGDPIVAGDLIDDTITGNALLSCGNYILTDVNLTRIYGSTTGLNVASINLSTPLDISTSSYNRRQLVKKWIMNPCKIAAPAEIFILPQIITQIE